jgi:hypothetical protein
MTAEELLHSMRSALEDERAAIRRLDAEGVNQATARKEQILERVRDAPASERPAMIEVLKELKSELRRNLVLLAHARDCLRQAIEYCGPTGRGRLEAKL